jgi:hypothetical protein
MMRTSEPEYWLPSPLIPAILLIHAADQVMTGMGAATAHLTDQARIRGSFASTKDRRILPALNEPIERVKQPAYPICI